MQHHDDGNTNAAVEPADVVEALHEDETAEDRYPPIYRDGQLCLSAMMEESVTWIDVAPEDDVNSPKHSDQRADDNAGAADDENQEPIPAHFRHISQQQRAPGIVLGMPKCLSC